MKITNVKESGCNNVLKWAIANGADIKSDEQLQSIINDELFYLVTMSDVNFFELFRLTQMYREKVRVIEEKQADIPPRKELVENFNGNFIPDKNNPDEEMPLYEVVEHSMKMFINLALQMNSDDDIIRPGTTRLFLPMLSRKFDVQIPVGFIDFVTSLSSSEEAAALFNDNYPANLNEQIVENESSSINRVLRLAFLKGTSIIRYNSHYDQLLKLIRYSPLNSCSGDSLYKFKMVGFSKYDNISRGEVRCSLFQPDKDEFGNTLKLLGKLSTPMKVDFVVQLPIQYMQMIENSFSRDELEINYEASMSSIIEGGLIFNDFITREFDEESEDEAVQEEMAKYNNAISAYKNRIEEANTTLLNLLPVLLQDPDHVNTTSAFAMLPAIYTTKAVITLNMQNIDKYINHWDPNIAAMFQEMLDTASTIAADIQKVKEK